MFLDDDVLTNINPTNVQKSSRIRVHRLTYTPSEAGIENSENAKTNPPSLAPSSMGIKNIRYPIIDATDS